MFEEVVELVVLHSSPVKSDFLIFNFSPCDFISFIHINLNMLKYFY